MKAVKPNKTAFMAVPPLAFLFGFLAVTPFAILLALTFDYKDWQFWAFWGVGYWWSVVAQYLARETVFRELRSELRSALQAEERG